MGRLAAADSNQADAAKPRKMPVLGLGFRSNQAHLRLVCLMACRNKKRPTRAFMAAAVAGDRPKLRQQFWVTSRPVDFEVQALLELLDLLPEAPEVPKPDISDDD